MFKLALSLQGSSSVLLSDLDQLGEALQSVTFLTSVNFIRHAITRTHHFELVSMVDQIFKKQHMDAVVFDFDNTLLKVHAYACKCLKR